MFETRQKLPVGYEGGKSYLGDIYIYFSIFLATVKVYSYFELLFLFFLFFVIILGVL